MSAARWRLVLAGAVALALGAVIALVALSDDGGSGGAAGTTGPAAGTTAVGAEEPALPGGQTGPPPWTNGATGLAERLRAIGLPALPEEGTALHIHQHLDV